MDGINIDEDNAKKENIPSDLNSLAHGAYRIPDLKRRKLFFLILFSLLLFTFLLDFFFNWIDFKYSLFIITPLTIYLYFLKSKTTISQSEVIQSISKHIDHSLGYYSTALTFKGLLLEPVWTVIVYDHNNPPKQRSIIEIDANTGNLVTDVYSEML